MQKKVLLGNEAVARGAYEAGCTVAAAYPGTPSTEIIESIARDYPEIKAQWSPNEKVALEVVAGASVAGARSMAAMKHVGLNVAADPLFTFSYTGVNGGMVIINADDPGAWSSQNEQDRHYARAAKVPMIERHLPRRRGVYEARRAVGAVRQAGNCAHHNAHFTFSGIVELGERENVPLKDFERNPQNMS